MKASAATRSSLACAAVRVRRRRLRGAAHAGAHRSDATRVEACDNGARDGGAAERGRAQRAQPHLRRSWREARRLGTRAAGTHQRGAALCRRELSRLGHRGGGVERARALRRRRRTQHRVAAAEHSAGEERSRATRRDGVEVGALRQRTRSHALPPRALGRRRSSRLSRLSGHALGRRAWATARHVSGQADRPTWPQARAAALPCALEPRGSTCGASRALRTPMWLQL